MVNLKQQLVSNLSTVLDTHYELFCDSNTEKPCITYTEYNNYDDRVGNTLGYSVVEYMIKVWDTSVANITTYAAAVDAVMRNMGFSRVSANELLVGDNIVKMMVYSIKLCEDFN